MEGKGAIPPDLARLRLAVLTAEPSGTLHATPAGVAALDPMASVKKKHRRPCIFFRIFTSRTVLIIYTGQGVPVTLSRGMEAHMQE